MKICKKIQCCCYCWNLTVIFGPNLTPTRNGNHFIKFTEVKLI